MACDKHQICTKGTEETLESGLFPLMEKLDWQDFSLSLTNYKEFYNADSIILQAATLSAKKIFDQNSSSFHSA